MSSQKASTPRSRYLSSLPKHTLEEVLERSSELESLLGGWVKAYPRGMREVRVPQLSLTLAAAAPFLGASELLPGACLSMWFFAVDDLLDEAPLDKDARGREARALIEQCPSLIRGSGTNHDPGNPLLAALADIRRQFEELLEKSPKDGIPRELLAEALELSLSGESVEEEKLPEGSFGFPEALRELLASSLELSLRGMRFELEWDAEQPLPPFLEYLEEGHHSVGVLPVYVCMLAAMSAAMKTMVPSQLPLLLRKGQWAALKIRLANDIRSYERELLEGKLNAIRILKQDILGGEDSPTEELALEEALLTVKALISLGMPPRAGEAIAERAFRRAERLCGHLFPRDLEAQTTGSPSPMHYAANLTAFVCDYYAHYDYHDSLKATGWNDIDTRTPRP